MKFPGGWLSLENSNPMQISDFISFAAIDDGSTTTNGEIIMSSDYNNPSGGTWGASPISITSEPYVNAVDSANDVTQQIMADSMNMQTKMANLATSVAPPLQSLIYLYGNIPGQMRYMCYLPLDFGGSNYDLLQISVLENYSARKKIKLLAEKLNKANNRNKKD